MNIPRLRMFAGPNGSGKSTVKNLIPDSLLGIYLNADDIEATLRLNGSFNIKNLGIDTSTLEMISFFQNSSFIQQLGREKEMSQISVVEGSVSFPGLTVDSYISSVLSDFLRHKLFRLPRSFTFETVMSSPDKISFLAKAKQEYTYRTYLYYVSTEDPSINVSRVENRVKMGGHNVAADKVISRYYRSMDYLIEAIKQADRAYIFDNSGKSLLWVAEIANGEVLEIKSESIPL
jgi:predicted ABC-type ATPase